MENQNDSKLVPIQNQGIAKVEKSIEITNKLIFNGIEKLFNEAFLLLNSKQDLDKDINYCILFESNPNLFLSDRFKFEAVSEKYYEKSISLLTQIIGIKPKHYNSLILRAIAFYHNNESNNSFPDLMSAYSIASLNGVVHYWKGNIYTNEYDSIEEYNKALELSHDLPEILNKRGMAYRYRLFGKKNSEYAILDFTKAININSNNAEYYFNRAVVKNDIEDFKGAIEDFSKGIQLNPNNIQAFFCRGISKYYSKNYKSSIEDFEEVVRIDSTQKMKYYVRENKNGVYFLFFHQRGWTNPFYDAYIEYANIYYYLGNARQFIGCYKDAINDYTQALKFNQDSEVYFQIGNTEYHLKDYKNAISSYTNAIELKPKTAKYFYNRINAKYKIQDLKGMVDDYSKILKLEGYLHGKGSQTSVLLNKRGLLNQKLKKFEEAINDFNSAINCDKSNSFGYLNRGNTKFYLQDYVGAISDYSKVIEIEPNNYNAYYNRSLAKKKINQNVEANEDFRTFEELKSKQ